MADEDDKSPSIIHEEVSSGFLTTRRYARLKGCLIVVAGLLGFTLVSLLISPLFMTGCCKKADLIQATRNMRNVGIALLDFENNYGVFPNDDTIAQVRANHPKSPFPLGTESADDYFHQLMATGMVETKECFLSPNAHSRESTKHSVFLRAGECGFAYVMHSSTAGNPARPILLAPAGRKGFDERLMKKFGGVIGLSIDSSARLYPLDEHGVPQFEGKDLFDPSQPFWGGKKPVVKWPK